MRGCKILSMEYLYLKFIDTLNFLPMALSKLSDAFDLPVSKGYFPDFSILKIMRIIVDSYLTPSIMV